MERVSGSEIEGRGERETERNLMKHRLESWGPTGRLWPSFTILLSFSFFLLWRNKRCPSLSFLLLSRRSGADGRRLEGVGGAFIASCVSLFKDLKAKKNGGGGGRGGVEGMGGLMEGELGKRRRFGAMDFFQCSDEGGGGEGLKQRPSKGRLKTKRVSVTYVCSLSAGRSS